MILIWIWSNDRIERFKYYLHMYLYLLTSVVLFRALLWLTERTGENMLPCWPEAELQSEVPKFRCNIHHHSHLGARTMNSSANSDRAIERETISHSLVWNKILYSLKSKLLKPDHRSRAAQGDYWERRTEVGGGAEHPDLSPHTL